jgi:hypothetical protein
VISKGNQRGGGRQLATHLLNQFDNERVELIDLRGSVAHDLHGAFHEWYAQSMATRCRKYLYSLSISPDLAKYDLTREQYLDFIARTERSLKLVGQPRAVVFHVKQGREHAHVVWSRIDAQAGKAVQIAHDRMKLRSVAQRFARDHGITLPDRMRENGRKDRFNERARQSNLTEKQQEERSGLSKEARRAAILRAWQQSPDAHEFVKALEQAGYHLARGDRRDYVVVDRAGEVHSLTRQLAGNLKAGDVKALLRADYAPDKLQDVETARAQMQEQRDALKESAAKEQAAEQQIPLREETGATADEARTRERDAAHQRDQEIAARRAELSRHQEDRRAQLALTRTKLDKRFATERQGLTELHDSENRGILSARAFSQPRGLRAFLIRMTGFQMIISARHRREDAVRAASQRQQKEALNNRHGRERQDFERQYKNLATLEKRERYSLETALKREEFQRIAALPIKSPTPLPTPAHRPVVLKPEFDRAANPARVAQGDGDSRAAAKERLLRDFAAAVEPAKNTHGGNGDAGAPVKPATAANAPLTPQFNGASGGAKEDLRQVFKRAADPHEQGDSDSLARARRLKEALERRQRGQERDRKDRGPDRER